MKEILPNVRGFKYTASSGLPCRRSGALSIPEYTAWIEYAIRSFGLKLFAFRRKDLFDQSMFLCSLLNSDINCQTGRQLISS